MLQSRLLTLLLVLTFLVRGPLTLPLSSNAAPAQPPANRALGQNQAAPLGVAQLWHVARLHNTPAQLSTTTNSAPSFQLPDSVLKRIQELSTPTSSATQPAPEKPDQILGGLFPGEEHLGGCNPSQPSTTGSCADPVDTEIANFWQTYVGLTVPGRGPGLQFTYTYNSQQAAAAATPGLLGYGWTHNYSMTVTGGLSAQTLDVHQENASWAHFVYSNSLAGFVTAGRAMAQVRFDANSNVIFTRTQSLDRFKFDTNNTHRLTQITDRNGYTTTLAYTSTTTPLRTVTDAAGRTLTFTYNSSNYLTQVHDDTGNRAIQFSYNITGELATVTDVVGSATHFTYGTNHHLLTITDPRNGVITNTYYLTNGVSSQIDALGHMTQFAYALAGCDPLGQCDTLTTTVTSQLGSVTQYVYDHIKHKLQKIIRNPGTPQAQQWRYTFADDFHLLSVTDPLTHTWVYTWSTDPANNGNHGDLLATTDPLNRTTRATYNTLHEPLVVTDARQIPITYTYDISGNLTNVTRPLTETAQTITSTFGYDPARPGDVLTVTNTLGNKWLFAYNTNGYITTSSNPLAETTVYTADNIGRLLNVRLPSDITPTVSTYNAWGGPTRVTNVLGYTTVYTYDGNRNLNGLEDPNHRVTAYTYDLANQLTRVTQPDGTHSDYGYDADGNVISQTNALTQTTRYGYDVFERVISNTNPLGRTTLYSYDLASRLVTLEDPQARKTTYGYDMANQLTSIAYSDGTTPNVSFGYNTVGQRTVMTDGIGTTSYTYDSLGRLTGVQQGNARAVGYQYDLASRLWKLTYPNFGNLGSWTATRGYNAANQLTSVTDWMTNTTSFGYDPKGNLTDITYANGTRAGLAYDAANQVYSITHRVGITATPFISLTYTLDPVGLLQTADEKRSSLDHHRYEYDPLNRLRGDDLSVSSTISRTWSYDGATEITQTTTTLSGGDPTISTRQYDAANELTDLSDKQGLTVLTSFKYSYDNNGDRIKRTDQLNSTALNYAYDQAQRLIDITGGLVEPTYGYNGDGLRLRKTTYGIGLPQTTNYTWDVGAGLPLLLQDNTASYIYGPGGLLIEQVQQDGTPYYYHTDRLGSVRALTNGSGTVVNTADYNAYGQPTSTSGSVANPFGYAGEYTDSETGFLYLRVRYYDPATQQFLTVDPLLAATDQAYNYAGGNPTNYTDPTGLWAIGVCLNGSVTVLGLGYIYSGCLVFTSAGELGLQKSEGPQGNSRLFGVDIGLGLEGSLAANKLSDLEGPFIGVGCAVGEIPIIAPLGAGGDFMMGPDSAGNFPGIDEETLQVSFGASAIPVEGRGEVATTTTVGTPFSIPGAFNSFIDHLMRLDPKFNWWESNGLIP